jgi:hypothetical protein
VRVEVTPRALSVVAGQSAVITVSVTNSASIISGHRVRVLGVDPRWVTLDQDRLSLFPDATGVVVATVTLPKGVPAGPRTIAVEVTELTPPHETTLLDVEVTVPAEPGLTLALDPVSVQGGRSAKVAVVAQNTGNSVIEPALDGRDETGEVSFAFDQSLAGLTPGEQRVGQATLRARRPWFGSPKIRQYSIVGGPPGAPVVAAGTWLQKPRLARGSIALIGLLAAATVFAVVVAVSLSSVVSTSNNNRNLALQVAQAAQAGNANAGTAGVSGVASQAGTNQPVSGVTVDLYQTTNITSPIVSTATNAQGAYRFSGLAAGAYLLQFQGAGFASLWYPNSLSSTAATPVNLKSGQVTANVDVTLGGLPGSITGQVVGADPTGAILTLEIPGSGGIAAAAAAAVNAAPAGSAPANAVPATTTTTAPATTTTAPPSSSTTSASSGQGSSPQAAGEPSGLATLTAASVTNPVPANTGSAPAIMTSQVLSATGNFTLSNIPSPGTFDLVVVKTGYAPAVAAVDLSGGETRSGIVITLHKGDGTVSGTVSTAAGPLGGAGIAASDGTNTVSTVSETAAGSVGQFQLADLPTPDTLTVVVTATGYASQTLSVTLAPHEQLTGLSVILVPGTGTVSGTVTSGGQPAGGVTVTATNGQQTVSTVTLSQGAVGTYQLNGLAVPGNYTITFARPDLASQTRAIALTSAQGVLKGLNADLVAQTATVYGTITQTDGQPVHDVTVQLSSGKSSYQVVSADAPTPGAYEIDGVTPGTYTISFSRTGGQPTSSIISLAAGQSLDESPVLTPAASVYGVVVDAADPSHPVAQAQVTLYLATQYPTVAAATTLTDSSGAFTFENVDAPQNYIVGVAVPQGSSNQETVLLTTGEGVATPVCGSKATGNQNPPPSTTSSTSASSSTTSSTTTTTTPPTTTAPGGGQGACNPSSDPLKVNIP